MNLFKKLLFSLFFISLGFLSLSPLKVQAGTCNPTLTADGAKSEGEMSLIYGFKLKNNCNQNKEFTISITNLPNGWTYNVQGHSNNKLTVNANKTEPFKLKVTHDAAAQVKSYNLTVKAQSGDNQDTKTRTFIVEPSGNDPPPDDGNTQCQDDKRVKPTVKAQPVDAVQKTGTLNGTNYEQTFTFRITNKNPKNAHCGKRVYQLYHVSPQGNWGTNPPDFNFETGDQVSGIGPGNSRDQQKIKVSIFNTTPAGTYNFNVTAQDTADSTTGMSDPAQFRFVVPQGGSTACTSDAQCSTSSPKCKISTGICVQCLTNPDCAEDGQVCSSNNICVDEDGGTGSGGKIHLRLGMDGIGTTGTLQEPSCKFTTNPPTDKDRSVTLKITSNTAPVTLSATARYSDYTRTAADACPPATKTDKGKFIADIDLPAGFTSKNYSVDVSSSDSPNLHQIKENFAINASAQTTLEADLPAGDIDKNSDPELRIDINDWNILRTCQRKSGNPASCAVGATTYKTDLDDDGKTDADDMTLFIQEFFYRNR